MPASLLLKVLWSHASPGVKLVPVHHPSWFWPLMVYTAAPAPWAKDPLLTAHTSPLHIASFKIFVSGFVNSRFHCCAYSVRSKSIHWTSGFLGFWVYLPIPVTFTKCCVMITVALSHPSQCCTWSAISLSLWNVMPLVCLGIWMWNVQKCPSQW